MKLKLLFTNAGRRTYLIKYALELADMGYPLEVCASDANEHVAALHVDRRVTTYLTPLISEGEEVYADTIVDLCRQEKIDLVIPLMDYEMPALSRRKEQLLANGTRAWVSSPKVITTCLDKHACHDFCRVSGINTPRSWFGRPDGNANFPLIRKRILGSGSVGQRVIRSAEELPAIEDSAYFYQEFIPGVEYGMDVLNDWDGNYVHSYSRRKLLMRAGETDKAISEHSEQFESLARQISQAFGHVGNLDIDMILAADGQAYFIDFNPRFGGGYPFTHHSGFNYLKAIVDMSMGRRPVFPTTKRSITGMKGLELFYFNSTTDGKLEQRAKDVVPKANSSPPGWRRSDNRSAKYPILVSASGRRVELMRLLARSARELGLAPMMIASDVNYSNGTCHLADEVVIVPSYSKPDACLETLTRACREKKIKLIVPTIDRDLPFYSEHIRAFEEIGTHVMISSGEAIQIGNDKKQTHDWLVSQCLPTVRQIDAGELLRCQDGWEFPLFAKPRFGSSSLGAHVVEDIHHLRQIVHAGEYIVQEIAKGREYTVDVFVDREGKCRCAVPRLRLETRGGEVTKGMTVRCHTIEALAKRVAELLPGARGVMNIQMFYEPESDEVSIIEINPRFGGGYPLTHQAGAPMARWVIEDALGLPLSGIDQPWTDGMVMLRYDEAVFVNAKAAGISSPILQA